ncbi:MAG: adenosylcobinamide-GDP ribazoletransferase [Firmicutes bacterium]|nr:adenosylcobinamide-GDP ribazoletransferase [Bacillota bacterium]
MKVIIGFFMAWGNFITLPCPYKRWDNNLKNMMLAMLPGVGLVVGVLWMLLYAVIDWLVLPPMIASLIMTLYIFAVCGFMHMDGFMDCNDAIMSRRPLEDRQRILKDSLVGAFAVVTAIFLILAWFAAMTTVVTNHVLNTFDLNLLLIPVLSRGVSGLHVLTCKPIGHSQYVKDYEDKSRSKYRIALILQMAVIAGLAACFSDDPAAALTVTAAVVISCIVAIFYARKNLGGMSGDIAGYGICISELAGMLALAII